MKTTRFVCLLAALTASAAAQQTPAIASAIDREIGDIEKLVTDAAVAMPEDKFGFTPERLNLASAGYKDVRTFAQQVKHVAASNYAIWSSVTGDEFPKDFLGGNGPESVRTKAEILKFLKDSFAQGHKAAATLNLQNLLEPVGRSKSLRLRMSIFGVEHAYDHYGQMVEYLRMSGIVPPASR